MRVSAVGRATDQPNSPKPLVGGANIAPVLVDGNLCKALLTGSCYNSVRTCKFFLSKAGCPAIVRAVNSEDAVTQCSL